MFKGVVFIVAAENNIKAESQENSKAPTDILVFRETSFFFNVAEPVSPVLYILQNILL